MPGTVQMTARDILYRLQMSRARAIVAGEDVAQAVDTVAPDCPSLKTKLLVSAKGRDGVAGLQDAPAVSNCTSFPGSHHQWALNQALRCKCFPGQVRSSAED